MIRKPEYVLKQPVVIPAAVFDSLELSYVVHKGGDGGQYNIVDEELARKCGIPEELNTTHIPCCLIGHARFLDGVLPGQANYGVLVAGDVENTLNALFGKRRDQNDSGVSAEGENDAAYDRLLERREAARIKAGRMQDWDEPRFSFKKLAREMNLVRGA